MTSRGPGHRSGWAIGGTWTARGAVAVLALLSVLAVRATALYFPLRTEVGYGDSYILYDVQWLQRTGEIYRDPAVPPYLPAQYSPLVYVLLSLPGRMVAGDSLFGGPGTRGRRVCWLRRAGVLDYAAVDAGAGGRRVGAGSGGVDQHDVAVAASDPRGFPAICCSLAAIRLLLSPSPWAVAWAGLAAGLAAQFKVTFVAAGAAGMVWLAASRDWEAFLGLYAGRRRDVGGPLCGVGPARAADAVPDAGAQPGVRDVVGALYLLGAFLSLPAFVLAVVGLLTFSWRIDRSWRRARVQRHRHRRGWHYEPPGWREFQLLLRGRFRGDAPGSARAAPVPAAVRAAGTGGAGAAVPGNDQRGAPSAPPNC